MNYIKESLECSIRERKARREHVKYDNTPITINASQEFKPLPSDMFTDYDLWAEDGWRINEDTWEVYNVNTKTN